MAKPVRFRPVKTPHGWRLNIPPKYSETGKRQQLFYRTQQKALDAAADLKAKVETFGVQARAIAPTLAERATAADLLLRPYGIDLLEAARIVVGIRERESASKTLAEAADLWLADCEGLREKTRTGYRQTANRMKTALGDRILATLTAEDLQTALIPAGTPQTAASFRLARGKAFWRWSAKRGWCSADVFDGVNAPRAPREADEIEILTVAEAAKLLAIAEKHFPQAVPSYALQLFAGIRVEELARLDASHVSTEGIDLPAAVTKKGRRRHITPNATLKAWLEWRPFAPCPNWRRVDRACRYLAGWKLAPDPDLVPADKVRDDDVEAREWPQNALRHSHASYAVAAGASLESLLFEFGHAGTPTVLRQHYVGRATKKAALAFFALRPGGEKAAVQLETVKEGAA